MAVLEFESAGQFARRSGTPTQATAVPGVPQNLVLTPNPSQLFVEWDRPLTFGGSPVHGWRVVVEEDSVEVVNEVLRRRQTSYTVQGPLEEVVYDVAVTAINGFGESAATTDTVDLSGDGTFDPRTYDWESVGLTLPILTSEDGPGSSTKSITTGGTKSQHRYTDTQRQLDLRTTTVWDNVEVLGPVNCNNFQGDHLWENCHIAVTMARQAPLGSTTCAILTFRGTMRNTRVDFVSDGFQGAANRPSGLGRTRFEYCDIYGDDGEYPQGQMFDGGYMTALEYAGRRALVAGMTVQTGDLLRASSLDWWEVTTGGTIASNAPSGWPKVEYWPGPAANQPFTSGTAQLIYIGPGSHQDGWQWTTGGRTVHYRCRVKNVSNSCFIIKSDTNNVTGILVEECLLQCKNGNINYVQAVSHNVTPWGSGIIKSGATWVFSTNTHQQPSAIHFKNNWWEDNSQDGQSPAFGRCLGNFELPNIPRKGAAVASLARWKECVQNQFNETISDANLQLMYEGLYNFTTNPVTIDQTVCQARFDAGVQRVDARQFVIWEGNRRVSTGTEITPTSYIGMGAHVDANGWYIGD